MVGEELKNLDLGSAIMVGEEFEISRSLLSSYMYEKR
jgi:hypothetical protein